MITVGTPPRIIQILHKGDHSTHGLFALGSDGLVYESAWDSDRQRYHWANRYDPLPAKP